MNRLQSELDRLYLPASHEALAAADADAHSMAAVAVDAATPPALIDHSGRVRAMVMALSRPPNWEVLAIVWRGVQAELELPAPAIAVSGLDGLELWFSLEQPIPVAQAHAFLEDLCLRYLPDIDASRLRLMPDADASALCTERNPWPLPARQVHTGNWSAFVAPDLAPVFADTPWIDIPPNEDGQAALLRGLEVTKQATFEAALRRLAPAPRQPQRDVSEAPQVGVAPTQDTEDPRRFLLQVMNDDSVAMALRIDAAKALLLAGWGA